MPNVARSRRQAVVLVVACGALFAAHAAGAQADYYNLDRGRPFSVEDAFVIERYAAELHVGTVHGERAPGGVYRWGWRPTVALGILPRTQVDVAVPFALVDGATGATAAPAGVDIGILHQANAETETLPAFAVRADVLLPGGGFGPDRAYFSVGALASRSLAAAMRVHANVSVTLNDAAPASNALAGGGELSRWSAGVAVDRTMPLESVLVGVELAAHQPIARGTDVVWSIGTGARTQLDPRWALDAGVGRRFGGENAWYVNVGGTYAFGVRWLIPGGGR
jgi:hypothetical protein